MKKVLLISISILASIIILTSTLVSPLACKNNASSTGWENLRKDEEWTRTVSQYLSLNYVEEKDRAAFTNLSLLHVSPALHSTYNIARMLKSIGGSIENPDRIIDYTQSLKSEKGAYLDSYPYSLRPDIQTRQAIQVLTDLGGRPEDVDSTVNFLLSLQYDDGTFLTEPQGEISPLEDSRLKRILRGTSSVIQDLIMLGLCDKIPQKTKDAIVAELSSVLGENGPFSDIPIDDGGLVISLIELLARIDPALVTDKAREFVVHALTEIVNTPADVYLFPSRVNRLLDATQLLDLTEAVDESLLERIRVYLKEKILPLQNLTGGFGASETVDPLVTAENVILANRLGMNYPNFDRLMSEIDKHWVGSGWSPFLISEINSTSYVFTYYAIEISKFSGWEGYDKEKVARFLAGIFSSSSGSGPAGAKLEDIYYAVMALKAMNGKLSKEQSQSAEALCLSLSRDLQTVSETDHDTQFTYALRISQEVGFDLPEETKTDILRLAGYMKNDMLSGKGTILPERLNNLWKSVPETSDILTRNEAKQYLAALYDEDTGAYNAPRISNPPATLEPGITWEPEYAPYPEISQTYFAMRLLFAMGAGLPDRDRTYGFVMACKRKYGFSRAPDISDINIIATFSALMVLKQL